MDGKDQARWVLRALLTEGPQTTAGLAAVTPKQVDASAALRLLDDAGVVVRRDGLWAVAGKVGDEVIHDGELDDLLVVAFTAEQDARQQVDVLAGHVGRLLDQFALRRRMQAAADLIGMSKPGAWQRLQAWRRGQSDAD